MSRHLGWPKNKFFYIIEYINLFFGYYDHLSVIQLYLYYTHLWNRIILISNTKIQHWIIYFIILLKITIDLINIFCYNYAVKTWMLSQSVGTWITTVASALFKWMASLSHLSSLNASFRSGGRHTPISLCYFFVPLLPRPQTLLRQKNLHSVNKKIFLN